MKTYSIPVLCATVLIATGIVVYGHTNKSPQSDSIKIGVITPLTGETATHGIRVRHGIELALEQINGQGGIGGKKIEAVYEDSGCDGTKATAAVHKLLAEDIRLFLGPQCSGAAMAGAPILEEHKAVMLTSVASTPDLSHAGDYIFRISETGALHGARMAEFAVDTLNTKRAAILYINLDNGVAYKDSFTKKYEEMGGKIVATEAYDKGTTDFRAQLTKIKSLNPEVIYIGGQAAEYAVKQIKELGITAKITSMNGIEVPELFSVAGDAAEGIFFTSSAFNTKNNNEAVEDFIQTYNARYDEDAETFSANGYDALTVLANSIRLCGSTDDTECIKDQLYNTNHVGISGNIEFDKNGDVHKELTIKTVADRTFVPFTTQDN